MNQTTASPMSVELTLESTIALIVFIAMIIGWFASYWKSQAMIERQITLMFGKLDTTIAELKLEIQKRFVTREEVELRMERMEQMIDKFTIRPL